MGTKKNNPPLRLSQIKTSTKKIGIGILLVVALIAIGRITYNSMVGNRIVQYDNKFYLYSNPLMQAEVPLKDFITTPVGGTYSAIPMLMLRGEFQQFHLYEVNEGQPRKIIINKEKETGIQLDTWNLCDGTEYNLISIWVHICNSTLVFIFWFLLVKGSDKVRLAAAFITALSFCIIPSHVETVAWISDSNDLWGTFFSLLALIAYILSKNNVKTTIKVAGYTMAYIFFTCALLSKATTTVLYPIFILLDYFVFDEPLNLKLFIARGKWLLLMLCVVAGVFAMKREQVVNTLNLAHFTVIERFFFSGYALLYYFILWIVPADKLLCVAHVYPEKNWYLFASPFVAGILMALFIWRFHRNKFLMFCLLSFLVSIAPLLQFISFNKFIIAERYTYFSFIPLSGLTAYFVCWCWKKFAGMGHIARAGILIAGGTYLLWSAACSSGRARVWFDNKTLWTDVMEKYPPQCHFAEPYRNLGSAYACELGGNIDSARYYSNLANEVKPDPEAYLTLGQLDACEGNFSPAINNFKKCVAIDSNYAIGYEELAICYLVRNSIDSAAFYTSQTIKKSNAKEASNSCYKIGIVYAEINRQDSAVSLIRRALLLDPDNEQAMNALHAK